MISFFLMSLCRCRYVAVMKLCLHVHACDITTLLCRSLCHYVQSVNQALGKMKFRAREDKGDREDIPYTHPIP